MPAGVVGELYVGGAGVARGYLNRPELTAQRFVPNPFGTVTGSTTPATWPAGCPTASLEYLGRNDLQVKVRGLPDRARRDRGRYSACPGVRDAAVLARETPDGGTGLVAYLVPDADADGEASPGRGRAADAEQVTQWRTVFDTAYEQYEQAGGADPTFNIRGWTSSYTGEPIPAEEMRRWWRDTVALVRATKPRRVLEIGSGTGLLLFRLAGACEQYTGLDLSSSAIAHVRRHLPADWQHVTLLRSAGATSWSDLKGDAYDTVVRELGGPVPGRARGYLVDVLTKAAGLLAPGGRIVVGDVRHRALLEAFHVSVLEEGRPAGADDAELCPPGPPAPCG